MAGGRRPHHLQPDGRRDRPALPSDPNLQNIPIRSELGQQIRRPSSATRVPAHRGLRQIELRIMAHLSATALISVSSCRASTCMPPPAWRIFGLPASQAEAGPRSRRSTTAWATGLSAFGLVPAAAVGAEERAADEVFQVRRRADYLSKMISPAVDRLHHDDEWIERRYCRPDLRTPASPRSPKRSRR